MIYQGSRYASSEVVLLQDAVGAWHQTVFRGVITGSTLTGEIYAGEGTTLAWIAYKAYGDAELWWRIADANPDLLYPDVILPGTVIKVPYVTTVR